MRTWITSAFLCLGILLVLAGCSGGGNGSGSGSNNNNGNGGATTTPTPTPVTVTTTGALADGIIGKNYTLNLAASGGTAPYTWTLASGTLPYGATISSAGVFHVPFELTGTTIAPGTYSFTVQASDSSGTPLMATSALTIKMVNPLATLSTTLPSGVINAAYPSISLQTTGGVAPTTFTEVTPTSTTDIPGLPPGITLSSTGVISGTPTAAGTYFFGTTITDQTNPTQTASESFVLSIASSTPPLTISSAATVSGEVALPFSYLGSASGGVPPYTWSLAPGSASLPAGLALNSSGQITGTPTTVTSMPASITLQVTDSASSLVTQATAVTVHTARDNSHSSELIGQYAFLMQGFDGIGNPVTTVGNFRADGSGHITGGSFDKNGTADPDWVANTAFTGGSYGIAADNRGQIILATANGAATYVIALNSVQAGVAGGGTISEYDSSGQTLAGTFSLQTPAAFVTAAVTGGYVFGLSGFASGGTSASLVHRGMIGELQLSGGTLTSGQFLASKTGTAMIIAPKSGIYSAGANGRGTLSLSLPDGTTMNTVFYVVSAGQLLLMQSDPANTAGNDLLAGRVLQQTVANGNFGASNINGNAVFHTHGTYESYIGNAPVFHSYVNLGLISYTGTVTSGQDKGNGTFNLSYDTSGGTGSCGGEYAVAANGLVSLTGCVLGASNQDYTQAPFFYLVGNNQGFMMDFSPGVNTGYFEPQTATSFSQASLNGAYSTGSVQPLAQTSIYATGLTTSTGAGSLGQLLDQNVGGGLNADVSLGGTYTLDNTGRAAITTGGTYGAIAYVVSPTKALLLDLDAPYSVLEELVQ